MHLKKSDRIVFSVYLALNILVLLFHEPWRDEAEAWVIAKHYSLPGMLYQLSSEGQPALWYLLLLAFAKAGMPFRWISLISLVICAAAACLFLEFCTFRKVYKWLILFSFLFIYYNPVVSRNYSLVLLAIVMLISVWPVREEHPYFYAASAAFLLQTHVLMSGVAIGCMLDQLMIAIAGKEKRKGHIAGLGISGLSLALLVLELYQSESKPFKPAVNISDIIHNLKLYSVHERVRTALRSLYHFQHEGFYPVIAAAIVVLLITLTVLQICAGMQYGELRCRAGWIAGVCTGTLTYLAVIVYIREANHIQLSLCFMMILLFAVCTAGPCKLDPPKLSYLWNVRILFIILCLAGTPRLFQSVRADLRHPFSQGEAMAEYIEEHLPADAVIAVKADYCIPSVSAHTDRVFWNLCTDTEFIHYQWGYPYELPDLQTVKDSFEEEKIYYLSSSSYEAVIPLEEIELIHAEDGYSVMGEIYYLYKLK